MRHLCSHSRTELMDIHSVWRFSFISSPRRPIRLANSSIYLAEDLLETMRAEVDCKDVVFKGGLYGCLVRQCVFMRLHFLIP